MAGAALKPPGPWTPPDFTDIQGLVRFAHARLSEACFLLLRIVDRAAAGAWLAAAPVTTAEAVDPLPEIDLQIAVTSAGLRALGLPDGVMAGFSPEFLAGMAGDEARSRRLGDVGINSPSNWEWGGTDREPHLLVLLYALPGGLAHWKALLQDETWTRAFSVLASLSTSDMGGVEPFGFRDGISQPKVDWARERQGTPDAQTDYGNLVALGEFVLGYPNEYGQYTDRPLLDPAADPQASLPPAPDLPGMRDLGRNGTYLVLRDLRQDVRGFWQYLDKQADGSAEQRRRLAQAVVGREISGAPLVAPMVQPIAGVNSKPNEPANQFTFDGDADGARCPLGAHIRRANPRNADLPGGATGFVMRVLRVLGFGIPGRRGDLVAAVRFHRILRCGREYGPFLSPDDALQPATTEEDRGLRFICLNANITRQFEFVQNAWLARTKFDGLTGESDPLLGNREPIPGCPATDTFSLPQPGSVARRLTGLPQFVTVRGGAYFFLPGIRALRYLSGIAESGGN
jgi:deferrochelatase/peroxidase EfeB